MKYLMLMLALGVLSSNAYSQDPPFRSTISITQNIITPADWSHPFEVDYKGMGERRFWHREHHEFRNVEAYLFDVRYGTASLEFMGRSDHFDSREEVRSHVDKWAGIIGRLPFVLLSNAREVDFFVDPGDVASLTANAWLRRYHINVAACEEGRPLFCTDRHEGDGGVEEVLIHEGAHAALDADHQHTPAWKSAQEDDGAFISEYGRDNPVREDHAESFWAWFALRYRPERLTSDQRSIIRETIPNRLAYFDRQGFDMSPFEQPPLSRAFFNEQQGILRLRKVLYGEERYDIDLEVVDAEWLRVRRVERSPVMQ